MHGILQKLRIDIPPPCYDDPIEKIYTEITKAAINHDKSLDILLEAIGSKELPSLPSWVPEWSMPATHGLTRFMTDYSIYQASQSSKSTFEFPGEENLLSVRGVKADSIASCPTTRAPDSMTEHGDLELRLREVSRGWALFANAMHPYPSNEAWEHVLRLTLDSWAPYEDKHPVEETSHFNHWIKILFSQTSNMHDVLGKHDVQNLKFVDFMRGIEGNHRASMSESELKERDVAISKVIQGLPGVSDCEAGVANLTLGMRLFKTASGYLGKGLSTMEEGDVVLLIGGVRIPVIARVVGATYKLIGPDYVYGIMDGEMWPDDEEELVDIMIS